jgi:hypothetical protein
MTGERHAEAFEVVGERLTVVGGPWQRVGPEIGQADLESTGERFEDGEPVDGQDTALDLGHPALGALHGGGEFALGESALAA